MFVGEIVLTENLSLSSAGRSSSGSRGCRIKGNASQKT